MILVFIILGIIIFISFTILLFKTASMKVKIEKLHIYNQKERVKAEFILILSIYIFNRIKIFGITIDKERINNLLNTKKINIQKIKDNKKLNKEVLKEVKKINYNIEYFKLDGYFSVLNPIFTSSIYFLICSVIPIFIAPKVKGEYINKLEFLNTNQNTINVNFNCIISTKFVNIINILQLVKKKGGKDKNGKSPNRKSYAYSNE